jgi:hypothetical protein
MKPSFAVTRHYWLSSMIERNYHVGIGNSFRLRSSWLILLSFVLIQKKVTKKKSRLTKNSSQNFTSLAARSELSRRRNILEVFCSFKQTNVPPLVLVRFASNFSKVLYRCAECAFFSFERRKSNTSHLPCIPHPSSLIPS